ncbi:MAG TPA: TonB-dependent receptor [Longimicrobium sp.]|nr:TonB-dependent receptor [Longimicrobium sp.]
MKRIAGSLVALALLAGATAAHAQNGPPAGARPAGQPPAGARPGGAPGMAVGAQQGPAGEIRGTVRDASSGAALAGASIAVRSAADSSLVTGAVTRPDGTFRVEGLRPGAYYLRVSRLGYTTGTVSRVAVTPQAQTADVGIVRLSAGAVALQGITATTERSAVTTQVDRTVVNTRDLPSATGGNATDVLRNVPGVDVDGDGKVSVRGNENVAIQINGRPAPMRGDALTNFLKQLPSNMVDRVEVVPNPSAKYDPDGMGGILNIVLKQNTDLGTSGGFQVGGGTGGKYNGSGNLSWQQGNVTLFGSYGFNRDNRDQRGYNWRNSHFEGLPETFTIQDNVGDVTNQSHTVNLSGELKLGRTSIAPAFMLNKRAADADTRNAFTELNALEAVTGRYDQSTDLAWRGLTTDYSVNVRHAFTPQRHELSADVRFNRSRDDQNNQFTYDPLSGTALFPLRDVRNLGNNVVREGNAQVDYTRMFGATKLETGWKGTLRRLDNHYLTDSLTSGVPDLATRRTNNFQFNENVQAGYALLTQPVGKVTLQGGLRLEVANTSFELGNDRYPNDYTSLFPSAAATYTMGQTGQLRFSYSRRIQRPNPQFLNPFPISDNPQNVFVGNPGLKPEYTHALEASVQRSVPFGSLTVTPFYRLTENVVRRYQTVDTLGVTTSTIRNLDTSRSYGADVNSQLRLGTRLSGMVSVSGFRVVTDGSNVQSGFGSSNLTWSARTNLNLKLTPNTDVSWFQFYRAGQKTEQGRVGAFTMANFSIRQKVYGDKASLSLRVADPFDQMRFTFETADGNSEQISRRSFNARAVFLSFSYNFGRPPRIRQPRPDQQQQPQTPDPMGGVGPN